MKISSLSFRRPGRFLATLAMVAVAIPAAAVGAQEGSSNFEVRPFVGGMVQTGDQRDLLENSLVTGAELGWQFQRNFAVTGSFGWAPSFDRSLATDNRVDMFQYDLGVEGRLNDLMPSSAWSVRPYGRLGAGARTFRYRDIDNASAQTDFVGHGAIGLDVTPSAMSRIGLRIEARDNVTAFRGLRGEMDSRTARNDMQFTTGLTFRM